MRSSEPILCPKCGAAMNCHAEKIDYTAAPEDPGAVDPELGGVLEEVHACPECGATQSRLAPRVEAG
jgi:predicted RNA-binding Zn-ribbon protein involved in translation (DUF1610 family)